MNSSYLILLVFFLIYFLNKREKKKRAAAILHAKKIKKENKKEVTEMEELAKQFIGKECLIYTVASDSVCVKGTVKDVSGGGILVEYEGNTEALNLEYVTRIREWPRNAKGKKKTVFC